MKHLIVGNHRDCADLIRENGWKRNDCMHASDRFRLMGLVGKYRDPNSQIELHFAGLPPDDVLDELLIGGFVNKEDLRNIIGGQYKMDR